MYQGMRQKQGGHNKLGMGTIISQYCWNSSELPISFPIGRENLEQTSPFWTHRLF